MGRLNINRRDTRILPAGDCVLLIKKVDFNENFGKLAIYLENKDGIQHIERYNLLKPNGDINNYPCELASSFALACFGNDIADYDPVEMKGHYIHATVLHREYKTENEEIRTYVNIAYNKAPAKGFEEDEGGTAKIIDIDNLLG